MRIRPTRRHGAAAVTALLGLTLLTACGESDGDSAKGDSSGGGAGGPANVYLRDVEKAMDGKESVEFEGSSKIGDSAPPGRFSGRMSWEDGNAIEMTLGGGKKSVTVDGATYMQMTMPMFPGKTWARMSHTQLAERDVTGKFLADVVTNGNPTRSVALLLQAGDLKDVGEEERNGVPTRHLSGTVEFGKLVADLETGLTQQDIEALRAQQAALGVSDEKLDVWVDSDKLVVHAENHTQSDQGLLVFEGDYKNYGAKFDIVAPPADQVFDLNDLTKGLPSMPSMPSMPGMPSMPPGMPGVPSMPPGMPGMPSMPRIPSMPALP